MYNELPNTPKLKYLPLLVLAPLNQGQYDPVSVASATLYAPLPYKPANQLQAEEADNNLFGVYTVCPEI
jgi:hypothetical protein